jgi:NAD(P)-dependent dehydrogenase (short-subunit alcohol dehydrogenase family)
MRFAGKVVVVTGASRDFGATLAWSFARHGARVYLTARRGEDAAATSALVRRHVPGADVVAARCDLAVPDDSSRLADTVAAAEGVVDILVNNGAVWLDKEFAEATPAEIIATVNSGLSGSILVTRALLPLLARSSAPDIVNLVSKCGEPGYHGSSAHEAFYAAKAGHAAFAAQLGHRRRDAGLRVLSLFPPNFRNTSPFDPAWAEVVHDSHAEPLNARSVLETIEFALSQPRSCYIREIRFEENRER